MDRSPRGIPTPVSHPINPRVMTLPRRACTSLSADHHELNGDPRRSGGRSSRSPPLSPPRGVEWVIWQIVVRCLETHLPADELAVLRQGKRVRHATRYHRHRTSRSAAMPRRGRRAPAPTTHPRRRIRDACVMPVNGYRSSKIAQVSENTAIMARMAASRTSPASASTRWSRH